MDEQFLRKAAAAWLKAQAEMIEDPKGAKQKLEAVVERLRSLAPVLDEEIEYTADFQTVCEGLCFLRHFNSDLELLTYLLALLKLSYIVGYKSGRASFLKEVGSEQEAQESQV